MTLVKTKNRNNLLSIIVSQVCYDMYYPVQCTNKLIYAIIMAVCF